ncbi:hypothetical protein LEP1GSC125_3300 [Leptospira mayottensis 200901122]|uniref:Uncharacterized protein n=1 Tax=Leptospira mayottensis 200901122 TaxID=1193010 RepID=A0AA87MM33_9LEPT|nr:hypothetical protein LEP1GSC125_3300 [Leptospira mayottensis 200901122]
MEIFPKSPGRNSDEDSNFPFAFHMKRFSKANKLSQRCLWELLRFLKEFQ